MKWVLRLLSLMIVVILLPFYLIGYLLGRPVGSVIHGYKDGVEHIAALAKTMRGRK